jgi:hypothetical protein
MEQEIAHILASGNPLAIVALIAIVAMYLVINYQRKNAAAERNATEQKHKKDIDELFVEVKLLKQANNEFEIKRQLIEKDVVYLKEEQAGTKEDIKEIKTTLNSMALSLERIAAKYSDTKESKK